MKKIIYLVFMACVLTACSNEEELSGSSILLQKDFVITDDPNDPVRHERYQIYQEYDVPVYFNDTISAKEVGKDWYGKPIIRYETVDLNWTFSSYDHNVKYEYKYLSTPEQQLTALKFVRKYLNICSKPMRPFSIMVADTLKVISDKKIEILDYKVGFRTLVFTQLLDIKEDMIGDAALRIIKDMVKGKISSDLNLCAKFKAISDEKRWYDKFWKDLGNCPVTVYWHAQNYGSISVNYLFYGDPYISSSLIGKRLDFVDFLVKYHKVTREDAIAYRTQILQEIGNYGFIIGGKAGVYTPDGDEKDRNSYISAMLELKKNGFIERYGKSPLVMKKFTILYDYITEELGVEL